MVMVVGNVWVPFVPPLWIPAPYRGTGVFSITRVSVLHLKGSHVAGDYPTPGGFETRLYGDVDYGWGAGRRPPSWGQAPALHFPPHHPSWIPAPYRGTECFR